MTRPLPIILGPTAVGKTDLSLALARDDRAEIVGADSRQIYRWLDIGTAKPDSAQRRTVPHHLIDCFDPDVTINAAHFAQLAWGCIHAIASRGQHPLVVGGSGLYLRALTDGLFIGPGADPHIRSALEADVQARGGQALHDRLAAVDPTAASRIHPHDRVRTIRALEIYLLTGRPISEWQGQWQDPACRTAFSFIGLRRDREDLRRRITARTESMLRMGLVEEVRTLLARGYSPTLPALSSVGYKEIVAYLQGQYDLGRARELIEHHTWRLAKRQMTWFRRIADVYWISLTGRSESEALRMMQDTLAHGRRAPSDLCPQGPPQVQGIPCTCPTPI
jgi:tRNA dimethylallyltransferase